VQKKSHYLQEAKAEFASVADGWLIAFAKIYGLVIVTHETSEPTRKNKVKIPDVCLEFKVEYIDTFVMLRELNIKFGLK
jgi:TolB-like protein